MIKHCLAVFLFAGLSVSLRAQLPDTRPVDYKAIEKTVSDSLSSYYYPTQLKRYLAGDTLLDLEDYRNLYYGYMFQSNFSPYGSSEELSQIRALMQKKENPDAGDYQETIRLAEKGLQERPFTIELLNYMTLSYRELKDEENYTRWRHNLIGVIDAILSSGDGKSAKTAFHVAEVRHEYILVDILGFEYGGEQSLMHEGTDRFDYLSLKENDADLKGLFFNITHVFGSLANLFEQKPAKKKKKK